MKTVSINVMNLCVPCENRCRYCLLSYDGRTTGVSFARSQRYAKRFHDWIRENRPELSFLFGFGYSMEHPNLLDAIRFCQSIGSATGDFLQFDGMKFRTDAQLEALLFALKANGIRLIDLTFYGTEAYHDRFAARPGDYQLMMRTLQAANKVNLDVSVSIPLTQENISQIDDLLNQLDRFQTSRISCFIPHCEGRGHLLDKIRLTLEDFDNLSLRVKGLLNRERFRTEGEWISDGPLPEPEKRVLTITLTPENIDFFEGLDFGEAIAYLEALDDTYYQQIPGFTQLCDIYGEPEGNKLYSARDLYLHYQKKFISDQKIDIYDINDERQCFSRRF